jgi:hypothetical protein
MKPVQLYIFVSVIFFLFYFSFLNDNVIEAARVDENPAQHLSDTTLRKDTVLLNKLISMTPRAAEKVVDSLNVIYAKNVVGNALKKNGVDSIANIAGNSENDNDIQLGWTTDKNLPATVEAYKDSINKLPKDQRPGWIKSTLREFLACSGSWNACAVRMYVHVNTVRYRIRRIEELTGRDPSRLDDQVDFFLALRIR